MNINPHTSPEVKEIQAELIKVKKQLNDWVLKNDVNKMDSKLSNLEIGNGKIWASINEIGDKIRKIQEKLKIE